MDYPRTVFWVALAAGVAVFMPVPMPGTGVLINVSLFDLVVPVLFAWALITRRIARPAPWALLVVAVGVASITAHSLFIYDSDPSVSLPWLLRDTGKLCAAIVLFAMLCGLFQNPDLRTPASGILAGTLIILIPPAVYLGIYQPIHAPRTIYAATILGLFLLALGGSRWHQDKSIALRALGGAVIIVLSLFAFYSKSLTIASLCTFLWIVALAWTRLPRGSRSAIAFGAAALLLTWGWITLWLPGTGQLESIQPATFERSLGIRAVLWSHAWDQVVASFPVGIGLGQFETAAQAVPKLAHEGHGFVHNTFLGLLTELGILGAAFGIVILGLAVRAGIGWGWRLVVPYVAFLVPLLLLNDAQGVRIVLVVLAIGVMHAGSRAAFSTASRSSL